MDKKLDSYFGGASLALAIQLHQEMTQNKSFTVKETGYLSLLLKRWAEKEVLDNYWDKDQGHKKFTYIEFIWVKILGELIAMGIAPATIKAMKEDLFEDIPISILQEMFKANPELINQLTDEGEREQLKELIYSEEVLDEENDNLSFNLLTQLVCETILHRLPISLLLFTDGTWLPWYENKTDILDEEDLRKVAFDTHVKVSISKTVKDSFLSEGSDYLLSYLNIFTSAEMKLLKTIGSGEYDSITIHFKKKKMNSLELTKKQDVKRRIVDILQDSAYQNIEVKTHDGLITSLTNTVKVRL